MRWTTPTLIALTLLAGAGCELGSSGDADVLDAGATDGAADGAATRAPFDHLDLGRLDDGQEVKRLTVEVPDDGVGLTLVLEVDAPRPPLTVITSITAPDGEVLLGIDDQGSVVGVVPLPVSLTEPLTLLYPSSPQWPPLMAGVYTFEVLVLDGSTDEDVAQPQAVIDAHALIDRSAAPDAGGALDLVLWFTDGDYLDAASAERDPGFQEGVALLRDLYARVGVTVDRVAYRNITGAAGAALAVVSGPEQQAELFSHGARDATALNVFFIDQLISTSEGFVLLGEASSIPAVPAHAEMTTGGVILSGLVLREMGPRRLGETIAHEVGHALGLRHLSERDGARHDPLDDTPRCEPGDDQDGDGLLGAEECVGRGAENLMFWTAPFDNDVPQETLTDGQAFVLRRTTTVQ